MYIFTDRDLFENTTLPNSIMVKTDTRIRALGMLKAGLTQAQVAKDVGVVRTAAVKKVISKFVHKRSWNTRKLENKLSNRGHMCSKNMVHRFLRLNVGARSFRRQVITKINKNMRNVVFNSPGRGATGNSKTGVKSNLLTSALTISQQLEIGTDCIWGRDKKNVKPMEKSKFSAKIMIWGAMTATGASALHILPQNQTLAALYYQENWGLGTPHSTPKPDCNCSVLSGELGPRHSTFYPKTRL